MLKELFRRKSQKPAGARPAIAYEAQKTMLESPDRVAQRKLAASPNSKPEVLYYLAQDSEVSIRRAVAANPTTPLQADALLVGDEDGEVRCDLARKIGRLVPDLGDSERGHMLELAIEMLETLARDQLPRVRAILSEEIKHTDAVPHALVKRLAQDIESIVAAPVLEYSPLLSDADLKEIIAAGIASEAMQAIARRAELTSDVADAVAATFDAAAVATLLANESAQIREETLDKIIDAAAEIEAWHEPLVLRPELSIRAIRRIAGFVASALIETLAARHDLDDRLRAELNAGVRNKIESSTGQDADTLANTIAELERDGGLDDDAVQGAVESGQREFAVLALVQKSGLSAELVNSILRSRDGKPVTALAWKAGLSMRTALMVQSGIARVPPPKMLQARNGTDFPLRPAEMERLLAAYR